jgi:carboxyl-terminal processing protease
LLLLLQGGTEVKVKLARRTDQIPGVPGRPEAPLTVQYREVSLSLKRERVNLSPVYYTALHGSQGDDVGYIRLVNFSNNAASEMQEAIRQLQVGAPAVV